VGIIPEAPPAADAARELLRSGRNMQANSEADFGLPQVGTAIPEAPPAADAARRLRITASGRGI